VSAEAKPALAALPSESLAEMNERHLKILRVIQGKALEALRGASFKTAAEAASALREAIREERKIRRPARRLSGRRRLR